MIYNVKESGRRIKELRKQKGYTQESFADDIGISVRTYSGIESGAHSTSIVFCRNSWKTKCFARLCDFRAKGE